MCVGVCVPQTVRNVIITFLNHIENPTSWHKNLQAHPYPTKLNPTKLCLPFSRTHSHYKELKSHNPCITSRFKCFFLHHVKSVIIYSFQINKIINNNNSPMGMSK